MRRIFLFLLALAVFCACSQLSPEEQAVVTLLSETNDLQLNILSVRTDIPIGELTALLFSLELKGIVRPLAGGTYHLLM